MGFLEDLKRQAQQLQSQQGEGQRDLAQRTAQVEAAAGRVHRYLLDLTDQLQVIRPVSRSRYVLDRQVVLDRVPLVEFRFDARRKIVDDQELFDHIVIFCCARSGRSVQLRKDFVNEIEQLEARLQQACIAFEREAVRHPGNGKLVEVRYEFVADVQLIVRVTCQHAEGRLHVNVRNLDGLETIDCDFHAEQLTQAKLDELARWWVGEPHRFLDDAISLRRTEAR